MPLPETVLSSPLLRGEYRALRTQVEALTVSKNQTTLSRGATKREAQALLQVPGVDSWSKVTEHDGYLTPSLRTLGSRVLPLADVQELLQVSLDDTHRYITSLMSGIFDHTRGDAATTLQANMQFNHQVPMASQQLVRMFADALYWQRVVEFGTSAQEGTPKYSQSYRTWTSARFSLTQTDGMNILLTRNATLMLKDMCFSRFITEVAAQSLSKGGEVSVILGRYAEWADRTLLRYGDSGYNILKAVEPLVKVRVICTNELYLPTTRQWTQMVGKFLEKEALLARNPGAPRGSSTTEIADILSGVTDPDVLGEVFGFLKLSGHPYVDPRSGAIKSQEIGTSHIDITPTIGTELEWSFCHTYTRGYLASNGKWPKLEFDRPGGRMTRLEQLCQAGQPSLPLGMTMYPKVDWASARFLSHVPFDYGADILSLMNDRSLSYKRSEFDTQWFGNLSYKPPRPTSSNRVLIELLEKEQFNLKEICDRVSRRDIPLDWKIVTLSPKEREMKLEPRMFAMMVLEMRSFFVLLEHNIAEGVFKSLPEQTMTLSRSQLIERFLTSTSGAYPNWMRFYYEVDFSSWNLYWREETVGPIGHRLDQIYGTVGLFTYVHEFFSSSMINIREYHTPPRLISSSNRLNPPAEEVIWYNHLGGFEGIAQKLWTAATISMIHRALAPLGVLYNLMGQADNQVLVVDFPLSAPDLTLGQRSAEATVMLTKVERELSSKSLEVGQTIKPEECIFSTCFLTYGKELWLDGRYLSTGVKYMSRSFASFTPDVPTLDSYLASVSSTGVASTDRSNHSLGCLITTKLMESIFIRRELKWSILHKGALAAALREGGLVEPSPDLLDLFLSVPANLGGFPVSTSLEFLYRGHSDPLASSLAALALQSSLPAPSRYLAILEQDWVYDKSPTLEGLVADPYAAPIRGVSSATSRLKGLVRDTLHTVAINRDIKELCLDPASNERQALIKTLTSLRPPSPKVWHDLYSSSLVGISEAFAGRFTNSRTMIGLSARSGVDVTQDVQDRDLGAALAIIARANLVWKIKTPRTLALPSLLRAMRTRWGLGDLEGVTNFHPLMYGHFHLVTGPSNAPAVNGCYDQGRFLSLVMTEMSSSCTKTRGGVQPFLGAGTSDKALARWVKPVDSSPPLKDVLRILAVRGLYTLPDSTEWKWVSDLAQTRSKISIPQLEAFAKVKIGGTNAHRHILRDDDKGSFLSTSPNWASHVTVSSNQSGLAGKIDYAYSYTELIIMSISLAQWIFSPSDIAPPFGLIYCFELDDDFKVQDQVLRFTSSPDPPRLHPELQSYYSVVRDVVMTKRSASIGVGFETGIWKEAQPTISSALINLLFHELARPHALVKKRGKSWARPVIRSLVDLPDVFKLEDQEVLSAASLCACAIIAGQLFTSTATWADMRSKILPTVYSSVRRVVPILVGTLSKTLRSAELGLSPVCIGQAQSTTNLGLWVYECVSLCMQTLAEPSHEVAVYTYVQGSQSQFVYSFWCLNLLRAAIAQPDLYHACKLARRSLAIVMQRGEETDRLTGLEHLSTVLDSVSMFAVVNVPAVTVMRGLRLTAPPDNSRAQRAPALATLPPTNYIDLMVPSLHGGSAAEASYQPLLPYRRDELVTSWRMRPFPTGSSARHRWHPIRCSLPTESKILVIGIGIGGVCEVIPTDSTIVGIDQSSFLATMGQDFPTYSPPLCRQKFSLCDISYLTSGDVYDPEVQLAVTSHCRLNHYDAIIIDVERGSPLVRLKLRASLAAAARTKVFCRVLVNPADVTRLVESVRVHAEDASMMWENAVGLGREFVVGGGEEALGLFEPATTPRCPSWKPLVSPAVDLTTDEAAAGFVEHSSFLGVETAPSPHEPGLPEHTGPTYIYLGPERRTLEGWERVLASATLNDLLRYPRLPLKSLISLIACKQRLAC